jgi:hypothetical protein
VTRVKCCTEPLIPDRLRELALPGINTKITNANVNNSTVVHVPCPLSHYFIIGAVLKKIKNLGFGGPGLKTHVLKARAVPSNSAGARVINPWPMGGEWGQFLATCINLPLEL